MHRELLRKLLEKHTPEHAEEIGFKHQILSFVEANADCFERSLASGHITASAWLLNATGDKALLMHHRKLDRWFQLGGHCDGDPDVLRAAVKEAQEESGIHHIEPVDGEIFDLDVHAIPENTKEKGHFHYDIRFLLQVKSDEIAQCNSEAKELRWISKNPETLPTTERSVLRMFEKWAPR